MKILASLTEDPKVLKLILEHIYWTVNMSMIKFRKDQIQPIPRDILADSEEVIEPQKIFEFEDEWIVYPRTELDPKSGPLSKFSELILNLLNSNLNQIGENKDSELLILVLKIMSNFKFEEKISKEIFFSILKKIILINHQIVPEASVTI